ncbi:MAG: hypothetical protein IBX46_02280 [Desulfuromonadales bacterium]|nr:hypothetical protein [Desulfuromonadales bacterium]
MIHRLDARCRLFATATTAAILLMTAVAPAHGGCVVIYDQGYVNTLNRATRSNMYKTHHPLPANITTEKQCEDLVKSFWNYANDTGYQKTRCQCNGAASGGSSGGGSGFTIPPGATLGQAMALGILSAALTPPTGPSAEEIARKQAQEEEARRLAEAEALRKAEEARRKAEAERLRRQSWAGQMKGLDNEPTTQRNGSQGALAWKGIDHSQTASLAPGSSQSSGMSTLQRLACAEALSDAAAQYADMKNPEADNKARFYAAQAQKALSGERLEIDCPTKTMANIPAASPPQIVYPEEMNLAKLQELTRVDTEFLSIVRSKKQELSERKTAVVAKKKTAEETIAKVPPTAEADQLKAEAEALLRESEAELAALEADEEGLEKEEARLSDNLQRYSEKTQQLTQGVRAD